MLQIGPRKFIPVRNQSSIYYNDAYKGSEVFTPWVIDAHFVPADSDPGRDPTMPEWEYLRLRAIHLHSRVSDWRDLEGHHLTDDDGEAPDRLHSVLNPMEWSWENPLFEYYTRMQSEEATIWLHEFRITRRNGYLFTCEMFGLANACPGVTTSGDNGTFPIEFTAEIPFTEAIFDIPLNASDPVAAAKAQAARDLKLYEVATAQVTPADSAKEKDPNAPLRKHHTVRLQTPWRGRA
jgi:hypothetical protein